MHSSCCVSLCATNLGGAQISLSTVKSTSEHDNPSLLNALLRCQQNNLYELPGIQYVLHTLTVALPLAYHTAHHMSASMSGLDAPLHARPFAPLTHPQRPTRHSGHFPSVCPTTLEMACFRGTRWPGSLALNLRVCVRGDACMIPALSRRALLSSRTLKLTTGNQKVTTLDTNSA